MDSRRPDLSTTMKDVHVRTLCGRSGTASADAAGPRWSGRVDPKRAYLSIVKAVDVRNSCGRSGTAAASAAGPKWSGTVNPMRADLSTTMKAVHVGISCGLAQDKCPGGQSERSADWDSGDLPRGWHVPSGVLRACGLLGAARRTRNSFRAFAVWLLRVGKHRGCCWLVAMFRFCCPSCERMDNTKLKKVSGSKM